MRPNTSCRLSLFLFVMILTVHPLFSTCLAGQKILILKESQKKAASVIIYNKSAGTQKFAAQELKKYLNLMIVWDQVPIGDCFDVVERNDEFHFEHIIGSQIVLASTVSLAPWLKEIISPISLPNPNSDAFIIRTLDSNSATPENINTVVLVGGSDRALLFGVYDFLERLGCRWFSPTEEHVPQLTEIKVPAMNISESPGMKYRGFYLVEPLLPMDKCVDWQTKMKLNVGWAPEYLPEQEGYRGDYTLRPSAENMKKHGIDEMIKRDLVIFWGQHIISGSIPLLFPTSYTKSNPEYYALINGKRLDPNIGYQFNQQLCTSNPGVIKILQQRTVEFLRNHLWIDVLVIWANDVTQWCECENCLALEPDPKAKSRSATYCRMIRLINEAVQRELSGRKIMISHYYNLEKPPLNKDGTILKEVLPPSDDILSFNCVFGQCIRHAFNDPRCQMHRRIKDLAENWLPYYPETINHGYYWSGSFMKSMPIGIMHKIAEDIRYMKSLGVPGMTASIGAYTGDGWHLNVLNHYIYGKSLWNPELDVDATIKDFCKYYYGPASETMEQFWLLMEKSWSNFGLDADFMPEDEKLAADPRHFHGRWRRPMNIRWLIPNQQVFEKLDKYLHDARYLAAEAYNPPPMKLYSKTYAEYMPYVTRIQLLERFLSLWPTSPWSSDLKMN